ncbi:MAG: acyltransferase [Candidatus Thermoplasmatota archaeon]
MRETAALDGMRGVAALLVVGFHVVIFTLGVRIDQPLDTGPMMTHASTWFLGWGFIGVDFFFVLSAFLLSQPFLAPTTTQTWRSYASKRLLRVLPAYYASILLVWLLFGRADHWWFAIDWTELWRHVLFLHGFWPDSQLDVSAVYWTLAVELQFYLILPLLVLPFRTRWWPVALAVAAAISLAYRAWAFVPGDVLATRFQELQLPAFLWHFALGVAAARFRKQVRARALAPRWLDAGIAAAVLLFIVAPSAAFGFETAAIEADTPWFITLYRPLVAIGFTGVILLGCAGPSWSSRFFESRPLKTLGDWSYSLYLTHYAAGAWLLLSLPSLFALDLPSLAFVVAVWCVLASGAFYWVVERPALALKARLAHGMASRRGLQEPAQAPR